MTEITQAAELGIETQSSARPKLGRPGMVAVFHLLALAAAVAVAVLKIHTGHRDFLELGILAGLAVISELTATEMPSKLMNISASFLGIMLAAVLLGGPAASLVGALTICIGWFRWRERGEIFRQNLVTFSWFPLLSGLMFWWLKDATASKNDTGYYLLVFLTFMVGLALNFAMAAAYEIFVRGIPARTKLAEFRPIIAAELSSAILTLVAVAITNSALGIGGLLLFALVLVIFQYLVGELLKSEARRKDIQDQAERLRIQATTDDLTKLANRHAFNEEVSDVIAASDGTATKFCVMLLDLDHFKDINDTLGHQYGDDLLKDLGPRLAAQIGGDGLVARFGGDEFAIMATFSNDSTAAISAIALDVLACVREPVAFEDITLEVDGSIGIARYPDDGEDAQTLMRRADIAMYAAKDQRAGHRFYAHGQDGHSVSRLRMVGDFRRALESKDEIVVHFHPIVDLGTAHVHGAEALVRWQHPQLGLLQPAAFLEIVEQTGLIGAMTTTVLEKAIAECAAWHGAGRELTVSVNLSVRNLHDPMLSSQVAQMLDQHRLRPSALKLEITESMILSDPQRALKTVQSLSELGVRFAVDDFGTGHSSLANLRMLPVHELKIDRSFVTPMLNEESDGVIVRSTIDLGHALGLKVIAEGVEDADTLARLEEIRCDRAQGHFFSKPVPPLEFMRWVSRYEAACLAA